eukprot:3640307-Rhodomonas_salina.1
MILQPSGKCCCDDGMMVDPATMDSCIQWSLRELGLCSTARVCTLRTTKIAARNSTTGLIANVPSTKATAEATPSVKVTWNAWKAVVRGEETSNAVHVRQ